MAERNYVVKVRLTGKKGWLYVGINCAINFKCHATRFTEEGAEAEANVLVANNPGVIDEAKVVPA